MGKNDAINTFKNSNYFKHILMFLFVFLISIKGYTQVNSYTFTESLVGYNPLTGGTVAYTAPWDDHVTGSAVQVTLPFTFNYDYNPYTQFYISPNGFITFGAIQPNPTNYTPIVNATLHNGVVSAFGVDLISNGSDITYGVEGTAPNRTMVIQWQNVNRKLAGVTYGGDFNFQIRLNESDNSIDLSYGLCVPLTTTLINVQVGIRGGTNNIAQGDVQVRLQSSNATWLGTTINGVASANANRTINTSATIQAYPDLGLEYKYIPALPCVMPPSQPTALVLGATSISQNSFVGNSFTPPTPVPTNYLVLRSLVNTPPSPALFVNGTYYANGAILGATYTVVSNPTTNTFASAGLAQQTTYYFWVLSYNNFCAGAPFYNTSGILTGSQTTCSTPTVAAAATGLTGNGFTANWSNVATATTYELDVSTSSTFATFIPGFNSLNVGLVTSFNVTGLLPLTTYYYRVRAVGNGICTLNSATITVVNPCGFYTIPYTQNFDTFAPGALPSCFTRDNANADGFQWQVQNISFSSASRSMHMAKNLTLGMDDWFFLPGLYLNGGTSYRLFFRYNTGNTGAFFENLRVRLGNAANVISMTENLIDLPNISNNQFQVAIVDFVPVTTGVYYIGYQGYSVANQTFIAIDDVSVTVSPTCFEPTEVTIVSTGVTTATISWLPSTPAPSSGYQYYVSTSNTPPNASTIPTGSVGAGITTANITGLSSSTFYYVWVRGNCGPTDKSVWTLDESFNTDCITPVVTSSTNGNRCGYGTVNISAVPNATSVINWYANNTGGTPIFTGNNYTTPAIAATTTYYAEAKANGPVERVGPTNPVNQGGIFGVQSAITTINFNIALNTTFLSIDIFPMVSGQTGQIVLRNSSNIPLQTFNFTTSVSGGATPQVILLNANLTPGNYNLYFATLPVSGIRNNVSNSFYPYLSGVANIMGNTTDNTFYVGVYNWKFSTECVSPRVAVTASVSAPPALGISSASSSICENTSTGIVTISGYGAYNTFTWTPNTGVSGSLAAGFTFNPTTTTTYTLVANQTSGALCGNSISHTVTVLPAPPPVTIIPASASICENAIQSLSGSASASAAVVVFSEGFNGATNSWAVANTSVGGDVIASQWTLRPNNYFYANGFGWTKNFLSNDGTQFYLANSDAQSAVPGVLTRTTLTSPSFSLAGYTGASLSFWHFLRYTAFDTVLVEISTDNGTSWSTLKQFTAVVGLQGLPNATMLNDVTSLNAYVGNTNIRLRFNFTSPWGYVWSLDNVEVTGTLATALTWTPVTNLYTDAAATIPYVAGTPLSVVYARPNATTTYTAALTGANGCFRTQTVTLNVTPATNAGTLGSDQILCNLAAPTNLILTGHVGSILRWEYASDAAFTVGLTTIANTTNILTPAQMGVFTTIRYFRAVVRNGICNAVPSNGVFVSYPSSTWNGTTWSNGVPTSTTLAIFAGNFSSTANLNACYVRVNSGNVVFNSGHSLIVENAVQVVGGTLTFNNNASLVQINDVINSGNITYRRNTTPVNRYDYTYWSTPVSPQTLVALSPLTLSDKYFQFDPVVGNWVNIASFNLMNIGKGYIVRSPQTHDIVTPSIFNASFVGVPNNGTYTTPIAVSTSNFNLIGNPYPSAISADMFLSDPANTAVVDATIYLWTHNTPVTSNQYTSNDYAVYNYLGGTGTSSAINSGVNNTIPNGKIASGQSFFIKGLSNGSATFRNNMRLINDNDQFFRMSSSNASNSIQEIEKHRFWLDVVGNELNYKQTLIGYSNAATNELDRGFDSEMIPAGNSVNIYAISNDKKLSILGKGLPLNTEDTIPIGFVNNTSGQFKIRLYDFDGLFQNQDIYLEDRYLNTIQNLKDADYTFTSNQGAFDDRFVLRFTNALLSTQTQIFNENSVVLYKPNSDLIVDSGNIVMDNIKVFDVRGRFIKEVKNINHTECSINLGDVNQVYIIQVTSQDGVVVTRKYVN
jgi:hypothetical protein